MLKSEIRNEFEARMIEIRNTLFIFGTLLVASASLPGAEPVSRPSLALENPFFAFDNGVGRGKMSSAEQAALLKELGYDGIGYTGAEDLQERLAAFDAAGLRILNLYVNVSLSPDGYKINFDLPTAVELLKGRNAGLWLTITGDGGKQAEEHALAAVRVVADHAARGGLRVVLYPHTGHFVETTADGARLAKNCGRKNVGTTINLCHWLRVESDKPLSKLVEEAGDRLMLVSVNGADVGGKDWKTLIQPLGEGDFDAYAFLKEIKESGYTGPVGLQCYNIPGPAKEHLTHSMRAWKEWTRGPRKEIDHANPSP